LALTLLSLTDIGYGLTYHGRTYVISALIGNVIFVLALTIAALRFRRAAQFTTGYVFHFLLFAWLATYAVPYLGEYP
jgi:hypothetical protein